MASKISKSITGILNSIIMGLLIGGFLGAAVGRLMGSSLAGILLGLLIGGGIGYLLHSPAHKNRKMNSTTIQLREERLNISKDRVKTGDVSMHKDIIKEVKNIAVPVKREELVIQQESFNPKKNHDKGIITKTIRIPISEEQIDITKHPKALTNVSVSKKKSKVNQRITEILKKEKIHVKSNGDSIIIRDTSDEPRQ